MELKNLGKQTPHQLTGADASLLERIDNPMQVKNTNGGAVRAFVIIEGEEFTSVCPATGGPDFGKITIEYHPRQYIVESKSLKYYLESYRNQPIFHEAAIAKICKDLGDLLGPQFLKVDGDFRPRGGWAIRPTCIYA